MEAPPLPGLNMVNESREKNLFLETDVSLHEHCHNCVILSIPSLCRRYGCEVIACPHECGHRFHSCKTEEHLLLCPLVKTPCINACYGCPLWVLRRDAGQHLATCPASVVYCNMERNRKPLREYGRKLKGTEGGVDDERFLTADDTQISVDDMRVIDHDRCGLDLALAYSDQRQINGVYRLPRAQRKAATSFFNKRHPAMPLLMSNGIEVIDGSGTTEREARSIYDDDDDSSEDEAAARERNASTLSPVARECILCKIDPSSQHLHQLGSIVDPEAQSEQIQLSPAASSLLDFPKVELDENANESSMTAVTTKKKGGKSWTVRTSKGASFYADRGLLIDLSADFLPTHYPKCGSYYTIVCDQVVRRDEYGDHFANVHNDIVGGLDGWALIRCPLWRYGCGSYATRLEPVGGKRKVIYNRWRDAFAIEVDGDRSAFQQNRFPSEPTSGSETKPLLHLLDLPYDLICHICTLLDPSSLFSLAGACRSLNDFVRNSLLPTRGLVERVWIKSPDPRTESGRPRWIQGAKRWRLSKSFEPVRKWKIRSIGHFVDHIQKCPYYEPLVHKQERIPVLTFAKPFITRPSRRDMYRAVPVAVDNANNHDHDENNEQVQVFDF